RLAVWCRGDIQQRRRLRLLPAPQARTGGRGTDRDGSRDRLPAGRRVIVRSPDPDLPLLRRVRWRLIAWSGGSTAVVLIVLGAVLHAAVARSLAAQSGAQLHERVASPQVE